MLQSLTEPEMSETPQGCSTMRNRRPRRAAGATEAGNEVLAGFFEDVRETHIRIARRAEEILGRLDGLHAGVVRPGSIRLGDGPSEGDPGDVSPGQDDVA